MIAATRPRRQSILFGSRFDWEAAIQGHLEGRRFTAQFRALHYADLDTPDAVVPLTFDDYAVLRSRTPGTRRYLMPEPETVALCDNKPALNRFLIEAGLGAIVPTLYPDAASAVPPYIVKPAIGQGGERSVILRDNAGDTAAIARMEGQRHFRQQAIAGHEEFAVHFLALAGEIRFCTHVRYARPGALSVHCATDRPLGHVVLHDVPIDPHLARAVGALRYTGTGCIDCKFAGGIPRLFELNPRPGWSIHLDINRYLDAYLSLVGRSGAAS